MLRHTFRQSTIAVSGRISSLLQLLLRDEASSGKFLIAAVAVAVLFMNSPWSGAYEHFWAQHLSINIGSWGISETLEGWISEGLMAIFFLVVGLEIKRELVRGELRSVRAASLPIAAAAGGMILPALLYMAINAGHAGFPGWGIPMTTDIALAIGVIALVGKRIPITLRIFLLTLAVVDDIAAILVIAAFYTEALNITPLFIGAGVLGCIAFLRWVRLLRFELFILLGLALWLSFHAAGIHAAIAGAILGLSAPVAWRRKDKRAISGRLERMLIPVSAFVVVPLFALANAGVTFTGDVFASRDALLIGGGVIAGLVVGKVLGITLMTALFVKLKLAELPRDVTWPMIVGAGLIAGIGLTISIFIAEIAFVPAALVDAATISIFVASLLSATGGLLFLRFFTKPPKEKPAAE